MEETARPLVSAVIITHNRLELLMRAVKSVKAQTYKNFEIIVADDASTDGTCDYCSRQDFTYIRIPPEESRGGNHARNEGVKAARGAYVAFLDDDDCWMPQKIEKQMDAMLSHDCELVHCGRRIEFVAKDGISYRDMLPLPMHYGDCKKKVLVCIPATTTNILVKKDALFEAGLFDESLKFWQEYDLLIRLAQRKPFYAVMEPLSLYRVDTGDGARLTNKFFEWRKTVDYIHEKYKDLYARLSLKEKLGVHVMVWADSSLRSRTSGLYARYILYRAAYLAGTIVFYAWDRLTGGELTT